MKRLYVLVLALVGSMASFIPAFASGAAAQTGERCFPETGFCMSGTVRAYWEANGGLPVFGYPISTQQTATVEGTWTGPVQWFERDRLEDHSNEGKGVLAGRLGAYYLAHTGRDWTLGNNAPHHGYEICDSFSQTGYSACGVFNYYWKTNGGLARFGYPITEQFEEVVEGKKYLVQYFERRRMEYHPELPNNNVLLGLLARDIVRADPCPPMQDTELLGVVKRYFRSNGCPDSALREYVPGAIQQFENGWMLWVGPQQGGGAVYMLTTDNIRYWRWQRFDDTYQEGEPVGGPKQPPAGKIAPVRGFGKVWWNNQDVQKKLGWAVAPEQPETASQVSYTNNGFMVHMFNAHTVWVLQSGGFGSVEAP